MKAQINVSLPINVNVFNLGYTTIYYKDGDLSAIGLGKDFQDALNDFRIEFAKAVHVLANKR